MKKCKTTKPKKTDSNSNLSSNDKFLSTVSVKDFVNQFNDTTNENKKRRSPSGNPKNYNTTIEFVDENVLVVKRFYDKVDLTLIKTNNVVTYDVFVNDEYYGRNPTKIQVNGNDVVKFEIEKEFTNQTSTITFEASLV